MVKRLQNKIAESKLALPVMLAYSVCVWAAAGGGWQGWWLQLGGMLAAAVLMAQLNSSFALLRIYSRMVSCTFLALTCSASFLFSSVTAMTIPVLLAASLLLLFRSYQDKTATRWVFYAYACCGLATLADIHYAWYFPVLLLLTGWQLQALSWRTLSAAMLGVLLPYWLWTSWVVWNGDTEPLTTHIAGLADWNLTPDYSVLGLQQLLVLGLAAVLMLTGTVHYVQKQSGDKIYVRRLHNCFIWLSLLTAAFIAVQPQYWKLLIPILTISVSPLTAHFTALTNTKATNAAFIAISTATLAITIYNLWTV